MLTKDVKFCFLVTNISLILVSTTALAQTSPQSQPAEINPSIQLFDSATGYLLRLDSTHTIVTAIDKAGQIIWKRELDSALWSDVPPFRGKTFIVIREENRIKKNERPEVTYFGLSKESENSWCRSPDGSATLGIRFYHISFVGLDVRNGNILCCGRD